MRKYPIALAGLATVTAFALPGGAGAATKNGVTFETKYSNVKPNSSTGFTTAITGAPNDANGILDPANRVVVAFHRGTKFDTSVPGSCTAAALRAQGTAGCPRSAIVGTGSAVAVVPGTPLPPIQEQITAYNTRNGILFYLQGLVTVVLEGKLNRNVLTTTVPAFPVPGSPKGAVLTQFNLRVKPIRDGSDVYARTPRTCPGRWTVRGSFSYPNVAAITGIPSVTRCRR